MADRQPFEHLPVPLPSLPADTPGDRLEPGYTTTIYDPAGRATSVSDQNGNTTTTQYDPDGNKTTVTDPSGNVTTNCYYWETSTCASGAPSAGGDPSSLYSTTTPPTQADPGGIVTTYTYLPGGSTSTVTTPSGVTTDDYDANGDLQAKDYSNAASGYSATPNVTYTYYPDGSKETMTDGTGTTTYSYDANGDLTSQALAAGAETGLTSNTVSYSYFSTGARQTVTYPQSGSSSPTATYTYDASGQMASVTDSNGKTTTFAHDPDNNLTSTAFPNNMTSANDYNLDDAMTLTSVAPTSQPNNPIAQMSSPRDPSDLVSSESDNGALQNSSTFGYDPAGRLNSVNGTTVIYNPSGQASKSPSGNSQSYDHLGAVTSGGSSSASYTNDTLGDRTAMTTSTATSAYSYNQSGELTSVPTPPPAYSPVSTGATRVCDTRHNNNTTQCVNETLQPAGTLNVQLGGGTGLPVPSNATAVVLNVTGIDETGGNGSYLQVYAYGTTPNHGTSNVNLSAGATANNQVTTGVGLNSSGQAAITVYNASDTVDVLVDVEGYYTATSGGSTYTAITPNRICDTRSGSNTQCTSHGAITAGGTLNVTAAGSGYPAPTGATAVVADVTAINPTATTFFTLYAEGASKPSTSNLNAVSGTVVNKEVTIPLATSGSGKGGFTIYNSAGSVNVTVDVEGYFYGNNGSYFVASTPQRICDTRSNGNSTPCEAKTISSGGTLTVQAAGLSDVPSSATAVVVTVTTLNETAAGYLTIYPAGATRPTSAQINFTSGAVDNNEVTVGIGTNDDISIYNSSGSTNVLVDLLGYYTPTPATTFTYNGDGLRTGVTVGGNTSTESWDTTTSTPAILSDETSDYIYGPNGEVVEQLNASANTPLYLVQDQLGSTRLALDSSGNVKEAVTYDPWGNPTLDSGSVVSPIGYAGGYTDVTTGFIYLINRYYDPTTAQFVSVDPDLASDRSGICVRRRRFGKWDGPEWCVLAISRRHVYGFT